MTLGRRLEGARETKDPLQGAGGGLHRFAFPSHLFAAGSRRGRQPRSTRCGRSCYQAQADEIGAVWGIAIDANPKVVVVTDEVRAAYADPERAG